MLPPLRIASLVLALSLAAPAAAVEPDAPERLISAEEAVLISIRSRLAELEPKRRELTQFEKGDAIDREGLADFYAKLSDHAPGATRSLWVTAEGLTERARSAAVEISKAGDWGLDADAFAIPQSDFSRDGSLTASELLDLEMKTSLAILKYVRFARGGRMDPTDLSLDIDRKPPLLPAADVLRGAYEADDIARFLRDQHPQHDQFRKLREAYLKIRDEERDQAEQDANEETRSTRKKRRGNGRALSQRLLYNMEMWRWMPRELGEFHVHANIPEFRIRVIKDGSIIHSERMITGKVANKTPVFSDQLEYLEFRPDWSVPASIKVKEILPKIYRGRDIESQGLRVKVNGRDIDSSRIDWSRQDIRNFHIYQPPGQRNALGLVKFMFPNKHAVYFHDTPTKHLFNKKVRAYSHGCMRVRNPMKMATVLLGHDKGWERDRIDQIVASGIDNNRIYLEQKYPVHVTYFTARANQDGEIELTDDIYGHEELIQKGFDGLAHTIVKEDRSLDKFVAAQRPSRGYVANNSGPASWFQYQPQPTNRDTRWRRNVFGFND
jgi:murein L,D-transpeptidase YcbB/YkuD